MPLPRQAQYQEAEPGESQRVRGRMFKLLQAGGLAAWCCGLVLAHAGTAQAGLIPSAVAAAADKGALRVLAWPGYAEPEVVRSFTARTGVRVEVTVVDTDEALWQQLHAAGQAHGTQGFDVFAVNTAELQRYVASNLVQGIDVRRIPNTRLQLPRFRDRAAIPGLVRQGARGEQVMGIPFTYSAMGLIFDKRQLREPPTSMAALWDPALQGKVVIYNGGTHNFSLAALAMGWDTPFQYADTQWQAGADKLIALRRNAVAVYTQPEESARLFMRHHAALMFANYGMQQLNLLKAAGADVAYAIPKDGALAWLDCWAIPRNAPHRNLAHAWIDHLLGTEASTLLVTRQGLSSTVSEAGQDGAHQRLLWLAPVEDAMRRETLWRRIRSGDRLGKVMAP